MTNSKRATKERTLEKLNKINEKINKFKVREENLRDKYDHLYRVHYDGENTNKIEQINGSNRCLLGRDNKRVELPELMQLYENNGQI